jgi:excinuclease ABC subunit A
VKLASELQKRSTGRTVYVLDEPTTGLHFEDIRKLLLVLQRPGRQGQHGDRHRAQPRRDQDADWIIDMGPEGGSKGGLVLATGRPEEVAEVPGKPHRQFLRHSLRREGEPAGRRRRGPRAKANGAGGRRRGRRGARAQPGRGL